MKPENIEKIHESFAQQAAEFEKPGRIFSKKEYLDYIVAFVNPDKEDVMLEAAAGTCAVSRAFAPYVKTVVSMDGTPVMLETGRKQADKEGHRNIIFTKGFVEDIPFLDGLGVRIFFWTILVVLTLSLSSLCILLDSCRPR